MSFLLLIKTIGSPVGPPVGVVRVSRLTPHHRPRRCVAGLEAISGQKGAVDSENVVAISPRHVDVAQSVDRDAASAIENVPSTIAGSIDDLGDRRERTGSEVIGHRGLDLLGDELVQAMELGERLTEAVILDDPVLALELSLSVRDRSIAEHSLGC